MANHQSPIIIREITYNEVGSSYKIPEHSHALYQWYCVVYGNVIFKCKDQSIILQPDDAILISPGVLRAPQYHNKSLGYFYVLFENHRLVLENMQDKVMTIPNELRFDLQTLITEITKPGQNTNELVEALVTRILISLERKAELSGRNEAVSALHLQTQNEVFNQVDAY